MRGYPRYNYVNFTKKTKELRDLGYEVISPIEMDEADGVDFTSVITIEATVKKDFNGNPDEEYYLTRDEKAIRSVDGIALIEGWENSKGTAREIKAALDLGLMIYLHKYWVNGAEVYIKKVRN